GLVRAGCGGASTSHPASYSQSTAGMRALRLIDLDDIVPVIVGGVAVTAGVAHAPLPDAAMARLKGAGVCAALALPGRLLAAGTESEGERGVFVIAVLLLVAG